MRIVFIFLIILFSGCIEPINLNIQNNEPTLVIDGFISNVSYNESLNYPSSGRYFMVELTYTANVDGFRGEKVSSAQVFLEDAVENTWEYLSERDGRYILSVADFKAIPGQSYRIRVEVDNATYYSKWESLPEGATPMGDLSFKETKVREIEYQAGEPDAVEKDAVSVSISIPKSENGPHYYFWEFKPHWIYVAPLSNARSPVRTCWVTDEIYLKNYMLQLDRTGGYQQELFFFETHRNERIYDEMTILINQFYVSSQYYYFLEDIKKQSLRGNLFDEPPYSPSTNIYSESGERANGYFAVVHEQATRWYFVKSQLSYYVKSQNLGDCLRDLSEPGPPPADCYDCLSYPGEAINQKPFWWR